jgi:hypothetical protein
MLSTPTESRTSARRLPFPPAPPTPRAQLSRVVVGAVAAVLLGAGPAIAWDLSTQPPRAEAPSPWPLPSPWLSAGKQMKAAVGGIARVYLPRDIAAPPETAASASVVVPSPVAPPPTVATGVVVYSIPTPYHPYRVPRR